MQGTSISDLIAYAEQNRTKPPRPIPEAQIMELKQIAERYSKPCPFKVGDLVRPRPNSPIFPADSPWIVVEVLSCPGPFFSTGHPGEDGWGARPDFRAIVLSPSDNKSYVPYWNESFFFEPWVE